MTWIITSPPSESSARPRRYSTARPSSALQAAERALVYEERIDLDAHRVDVEVA